jgi:hypothetical protein
MGIALPQVVTSDRASGAQVIDGSLKFDSSKTTNLSRTPGSEGNRKTWTWSGWFNRQNIGANDNIFKVAGSSSKATQFTIMIHNGNYVSIDYGGAFYLRTNRLLRDTSGWYHFVVTVDTTLSTADNRIRLYINGVEETSFTTRNNPNQSEDLGVNRTSAHTISTGDSSGFDGLLSNFYLIDGQALGPEYFGYTDPLTNTWRPKKYEGTFGTNGFYLPMDGNSPIGQDKSGKGNDWTPVNFGGSVSLDKATGALPILNTDGGGNVARPGVFGSEVGAYYAVTVPGGIGGGFYLDGTQKPALNLIRGATYTFDQSDSSNSGHPLVFGTTAEGNNYSDGVTTNGTPGSAGAYTKITVPHNAPDTLYYHCSVHSGMGSSTSQITDETKADQYAWKNVFAAPLVGSANDVSNQINSGSTTRAATVSGATATSGFGNFYNGSMEFDGTNDYITWGSNTDWKFLSDGTTDYTMECWIRGTSTYGYNGRGYILFNTAGGIGSGENGMALWLNSSALRFQILVGGGIQTIFSHSYTLPADKWVHLALVNDGGDFGLFIDGIRVAVNNGYSTWNSNNPGITLNTGRTTDGFYYNDGYMQDIRIYKAAKYTQNFIPASTNPDILPDTPSDVSGSSKLAKVTDGAVSFDGSGDYLSFTPTTDFVVFHQQCPSKEPHSTQQTSHHQPENSQM